MRVQTVQDSTVRCTYIKNVYEHGTDNQILEWQLKTADDYT